MPVLSKANATTASAPVLNTQKVLRSNVLDTIVTIHSRIEAAHSSRTARCRCGDRHLIAATPRRTKSFCSNTRAWSPHLYARSGNAWAWASGRRSRSHVDRLLEVEVPSEIDPDVPDDRRRHIVDVIVRGLHTESLIQTPLDIGAQLFVFTDARSDAGADGVR